MYFNKIGIKITAFFVAQLIMLSPAAGQSLQSNDTLSGSSHAEMLSPGLNLTGLDWQVGFQRFVEKSSLFYAPQNIERINLLIADKHLSVKEEMFKQFLKHLFILSESKNLDEAIREWDIDRIEFDADSGKCFFGHNINWNLTFKNRNNGNIITNLGQDEVVGTLNLATSAQVEGFKKDKLDEIKLYREKLLLIYKYQETVLALMGNEKLETLFGLLERVDEKGKIGDRQFADIDLLYDALQNKMRSIGYDEEKLLVCASMQSKFKRAGIRELEAEEIEILNKYKQDDIGKLPDPDEIEVINRAYKRLLRLQNLIRATTGWHREGGVDPEVHLKYLKITPDYASGLRVLGLYEQAIRSGQISSMIDLGAGTSCFYELLKKAGIPSEGLIDVDNNEKMHSLATNPKKFLADITDLSGICQDASQDLAVSLFVFHQLTPAQTKKALISINKKLVKGTRNDQKGELVITMPVTYYLKKDYIKEAKKLGFELIGDEISSNILKTEVRRKINGLIEDEKLQEQVMQAIERLYAKSYRVYRFKKIKECTKAGIKNAKAYSFKVGKNIPKQGQKNGKGRIREAYLLAQIIARKKLSQSDVDVKAEKYISRDVLVNNDFDFLNKLFGLLDFYPLLKKKEQKQIDKLYRDVYDNKTNIVNKNVVKQVNKLWNSILSREFASSLVDEKIGALLREWYYGIEGGRYQFQHILFAGSGRMSIWDISFLRNEFLKQKAVNKNDLRAARPDFLDDLCAVAAADFVVCREILRKWVSNEDISGIEIEHIEKRSEFLKKAGLLNKFASKRIKDILKIAEDFKNREGRNPNARETAQELGLSSENLGTWERNQELDIEYLGVEKQRVDIDERMKKIKTAVKEIEEKGEYPNLAFVARKIGLKPESLGNWLKWEGLEAESLGIKIGKMDNDLQLKKIKKAVKKLKKSGIKPTASAVAREIGYTRDNSLHNWAARNNVDLAKYGVENWQADIEGKIKKIEQAAAELIDEGKVPLLTAVALKMGYTSVGALHLWADRNDIDLTEHGVIISTSHAKRGKSAWTAAKIDKDERLKKIKQAVADLKKKKELPNVSAVGEELGVKPPTHLTKWAANNDVDLEELGVIIGKVDKDARIKKIKKAVSDLKGKKITPTASAVSRKLGFKAPGKLNKWANNNGIDLSDYGVIVISVDVEVDKQKRIDNIIKAVAAAKAKKIIPSTNYVAQKLGLKKGSALSKWAKNNDVDLENLGVIPGQIDTEARLKKIKKIVADLKQKKILPTVAAVGRELGYKKPAQLSGWADRNDIDLTDHGVFKKKARTNKENGPAISKKNKMTMKEMKIIERAI
jgi:transposase-like protein